MLLFRNEIRSHIRRDHNQRYAEAVDIAASPLRAIHQHLWWSDVVVVPAPIIPRYEDRRVRPIGAVADRIHHRRHPRRPRPVGHPCVVRRLAARNHPAHVPQLVVGNVGEYLLLIEDYIAGPIRSHTGGAIGRRRVRPAGRLDGFWAVPARRGSVEWRWWWWNSGRVIPPG